MKKTSKTRVLFVCLGNICRSPTAHGVFEALVEARSLAGQIEVDSAGTGDWHVGFPPDKRAQAEARRRGVDISSLRARQVKNADFDRFDYVVAMDEANLRDLKRLMPEHFSGYLGLFLPFAPELDISEVPDPYYGAANGFVRVFDLIECASEGLLAEIQRADSN